jgi:hypothetical protein
VVAARRMRRRLRSQSTLPDARFDRQMRGRHSAHRNPDYRWMVDRRVTAADRANATVMVVMLMMVVLAAAAPIVAGVMLTTAAHLSAVIVAAAALTTASASATALGKTSGGRNGKCDAERHDAENLVTHCRLPLNKAARGRPLTIHSSQVGSSWFSAISRQNRTFHDIKVEVPADGHKHCRSPPELRHIPLPVL